MRSRGVPPLWLVYFSVDDVSAAAAKAQEAGGTVHAQPFDVAQAGRMALVQDPTGAMFALWQAGSRAGAEVLHEPGTLDWFELATNDPEKAGEFYEQVLGWSVNAEEFDGTPYTTCLLGEQPVAGILPAEALGEDVAPNWGVYFAVEDCAATVEKAQSSGGELVFGPLDMPRVGQFAGLRDPQGAAFAVIQPTSADDDEDARTGTTRRRSPASRRPRSPTTPATRSTRRKTTPPARATRTSPTTRTRTASPTRRASRTRRCARRRRTAAVCRPTASRTTRASARRPPLSGRPRPSEL